MKVFIYTEDLSAPFDEGIKNVAISIIEELSKRVEVYTACRFGKMHGKQNVEIIASNRFLISAKLRRYIQNIDPDIILYIPRWCGTFASFLRMQFLHLYSRRSKTIMVLLQPKRIKKPLRFGLEILKPDKVFSPSPKVRENMAELKIASSFLPLFVDPTKYQPISDKSIKANYREKYGIPSKKFVILHVGHINQGRNLERLIPLQDDSNQVLILSSSSTSSVAYKDESLKHLLLESGIIVIDKYINNVEEIYQLSDLYVFPVIKEGSCIGIPLSILEARACGLPILTTEYGGLRNIFNNNTKSFIYSKPENFQENVNKLKNDLPLQVTSDEIIKINLEFEKTFKSMLQSNK